MNPGDILDNRYQIVARLGAGGMGEVYKATHLHLGATRVIKVIHPHISGNADAAERFLREAKASTKVQHQNVATLHDFSSLPDGSHYMVWEYIDGENLAQKLRARGTLPPRQALRLVIQTLYGLEAIHRAGIVHRDISPENLMISHEDENVKIIDLGVAKVEDNEVSQTRTGIFVGKLRYAAPEQLGFIPEGEKIDARTDIYAVAMVLVELLTGRPPYEAKSPHEYFILHASQVPPKTVELPPQLTGNSALQAVIEKALSRDRNERFATAREFAQALEDVDRTLGTDAGMSATMALPMGTGSPTMRLSQEQTLPDGLHRTTAAQTTSAQTPPPPGAAATILTPLPHQGFIAQKPKQGSILPLLVVAVIVLLATAGIAAALLWPVFGPKPQIAQPQPPSPSKAPGQQPKVAEASVTVTTETSAPLTSTTPLLTATAAPTTTLAETPPAPPVPTATTAAPGRSRPAVGERPPESRPTPSSTDDDDPEPAPRATGRVAVYVDGGDGDDNDRALEQLRRQVQGARQVALRGGSMQVELTRALRDHFPDMEFVAYAPITIRFDGTLERRTRGLKRRSGNGTVEKNGRVIFRYELPDEVYRIGMSPPDAFARVLAAAFEEE